MSLFDVIDGKGTCRLRLRLEDGFSIVPSGDAQVRSFGTDNCAIQEAEGTELRRVGPAWAKPIIGPEIRDWEHPGPMIRREIIEPGGLSVAEFCRRVEVPRSSGQRVLTGMAPVSEKLDGAITRAFGSERGRYVAQQKRYDDVANLRA